MPGAEAVKSTAPLAAARTAEHRTRNVEGRRARTDRSDSHEKREKSRGSETANSRDRNESTQTSRVFLRLFVAISSFFPRHSLFRYSSVCFPMVARIPARKTSFHALVERRQDREETPESADATPFDARVNLCISGKDYLNGFSASLASTLSPLNGSTGASFGSAGLSPSPSLLGGDSGDGSGE